MEKIRCVVCGLGKDKDCVKYFGEQTICKPCEEEMGKKGFKDISEYIEHEKKAHPVLNWLRKQI